MITKEDSSIADLCYLRPRCPKGLVRMRTTLPASIVVLPVLCGRALWSMVFFDKFACSSLCWA